MKAVLWKLGGAAAGTVVALVMVFWALERASLNDLAAERAGVDASTPLRVYGLLFVGLVLLNVCVFGALTVWSTFLKANPTTRQVPVWLLVAFVLIVGTAGLVGFAQHAAYVSSLDVVPDVVSEGYIAYQASAGTAVIAALVLLGVRWAPGYRPRGLRER